MSAPVVPLTPGAPASVAIVIISKGRPHILADTLDSLLGQQAAPAQLILVVPTENDLPRRDFGARMQAIVGPLGACVQRNAGIDAVAAGTDLVAFFDDDFELRPDYLAMAAAFLAANQDVVAFSGRLLANGNIDRVQARRLIAASAPASDPAPTVQARGKDYILHGCNMVVRRALLATERFDEHLPLYSYGEDYDLTMRLERHGRVGKFSGCVGVHLESPGGRVNEVQRGYSLIANNWYFVHKGSVHLPPFLARVRFWLVCVGKTILLTAWKLLQRDRSKDWAGRLRGLWLALIDIPRGRSDPRRILEL